MEKLPNPEKAFIDLNKLIGYCLNPEHPEGQHKALVFKSALNIGLDEVDILKAALLQAALVIQRLYWRVINRGQNIQ
jgi:hypothetical protein